jgi:hypothetical protein
VVDDHLRPHQCQPQLQGWAGQVGPAEVRWLIGVISTAPGDGDAGGGVAGAPFAAPVDGPVGATAAAAEAAAAKGGVGVGR